jgi:predicted NACHT family NTPase
MLDFSYGDSKNSDMVALFIDNWFATSHPDRGKELRKALDETGKERIKDLARHPLRLALLCFTWQSGRGKLPDTKAELYEMFVEALYKLKKGIFCSPSN